VLATPPLLTRLPLAHGSGLDEFAFVLLPIVIFLALQWLSRRKQRQENGRSDTNETDGL